MKKSKVKRYIVLLVVFAKLQILRQTAWPINFCIGLTGKILRVVIFLAIFRGIVYVAGDIGTWTTSTFPLFILTFYTIDFFVSIFFERNLLFYLPRAIAHGTFDSFLTQPISPLFAATFHGIDAMDIFALIPTMMLWWFLHSSWIPLLSISHVILFILYIFLAIIFLWSITLCIGSIAFWTARTGDASRFVDSILGSAKIPADVMPHPITFFITWIFPLALIATLPTQAFIGTRGWFDIIMLLPSCIASFIIALTVWNEGLRRYTSRSS